MLCLRKKPAKSEWPLQSTKPGHIIVENPARSLFPRWKVAQRISKAGTVKTFHHRMCYQNDTDYSDKPPVWLQLQLFDQSFSSPGRIELLVFRVPSTPVLKTCHCLIFLRVYSQIVFIYLIFCLTNHITQHLFDKSHNKNYYLLITYFI